MRKATAICDFKSISHKAVRHKFIKQDLKLAQVDEYEFEIDKDQADYSEPEEPVNVAHDEL
jgi:hypothetical protein